MSKNEEIKVLIEKLSPCIDCTTRECGLIDGNECQKCLDYFSLRDAYQNVNDEIRVMRDYIHDHNLEWDLLSYTCLKSNNV